MFKVDGYKIVFRRQWHERATDINGMYIYGNGRYNTVCKIYIQNMLYEHITKEPSFTGTANLHPNDMPDKIIGKKIALRNAIGLLKVEGENYHRFLTTKQRASFINKKVRTRIWKEFWLWVNSW